MTRVIKQPSIANGTRFHDEAQRGQGILSRIDNEIQRIKDDPNISPSEKRQKLNVLYELKKEARAGNRNFQVTANKLANYALAGVEIAGVHTIEEIYEQKMTDIELRIEEAIGENISPDSFSPPSDQPKTNAGSSSPQATSSADSSELTNNPAKMFELLQKDPKALADALNKLDFGEKTIAQQSFQLFMQGQNRVESMISNAQKNAHDTQKAIISNMRV